MTEQPSWAGDVLSYTAMRGPLPLPQWDEVSQNTLDDLRLRLRESVTESILMAVRGFFLPGPLGTAFEQLVDWAEPLRLGLEQGFKDVIEFFTGLLDRTGFLDVLEQVIDFFGTITDALRTNFLAVFKQVTEAFVGLGDGTIIATFLTVFKQVINFFGTIADGLRTNFLAVFKQVIDFFGTITAGVRDNFLAVLKQVTEAFVGLGNGTVIGAFLSALTEIINTLKSLTPPTINQIWSRLNDGAEGIGKTLADILTGVGDFVEGLVPAVTGIPGTLNVGSIATWAQGLITKALTWFDLKTIYGEIPEKILGVIPIANINLVNPELMSQGGFDTSTTLAAGTGWAWDGTTTRIPGSSGSAKVTGNGTALSLYSNQSISVAPGDLLYISCWVKSTGTVGAGAITLSVVEFTETGVAGTQSAGSAIASRAGSATFVQIGSTAGPPIVGTAYTVPAGITSIRVKVAVTAGAATGSTVWFDDISVKKTGLLSGDWMNGLFGTVSQDIGSTLNELHDGLGDGNTTTPAGTQRTPAQVRARGATVRGSAVAGENKSTALNTALFNSQTVAPQILTAVVPSLDAGTKLTGTVADGQLGPIRDLVNGQIDSGPNLIPNAGFERLGFLSSNLFVTEQKRRGARSLKLTSNGVNYSSHGMFSDNVSSFQVPVTPGDVYYYELWYRGHANNLRHRQLQVNGTAGTFTITVGADTTGNIAFNATAATVQAALVALASVGAGNATVTGANINVSPGLTMVFGTSVTGAISVTTTLLTGGGINLFNNGIFMQATSYNQDGTATGFPSVSSTTADDDNGVWKKLSGYLTIPAGTVPLPTVSADFRLYVNFPMPNGTIYYFDDAFLARVTEANQLNKALYGPSVNVPGAAILTAQIPNGVDATKLSGTVDLARIPTITNAKLDTGIDATKLTAGTLPVARITDNTLPGAKLVNGDVTTAKIGDLQVTGAKTAGLDAAKITSGSLSQALVTDLDVDLGYATDTADDATAAGLLNASDILELKSAQNAGSNSGYAATDTFNTVSASLTTANWNISVTGVNGQMGTDGNDAYWVNGATTTGTTTEVDYWKTPTNGDYQLVTMVLGTRNNFNDIRLFARMDSTRLNYMMVIHTSTTLALWRVLAGSAVQVGSTYTLPGFQSWKAGDTIQLFCGVGTNPRQHQVRRNNAVVIDPLTADTTSIVGSSNRFAGLGMRVTGTSGQIYQPGKVAAWSVSDNTPPEYVGSGFRAYKSSGTNAITANNFNLLPASFYISEEYRTSDFTYLASANNKLTVSIEGWYHVSVNIGLSINTMVVDMAAALYKNGTAIKKGGSFWGVSTVGRGPAAVNGTFMVYLVAGDYIQPGYWQTTAYGASGTMSADIYTTYFEVSLINKSLL